MTADSGPLKIQAQLVCVSVAAAGRDTIRVQFAGALDGPPRVAVDYYDPRPDSGSTPRVGGRYDVVITPAQD